MPSLKCTQISLIVVPVLVIIPITLTSLLLVFELINKCVRDLKLGKASGPDELMAEHLKYAHPILIYHSCILFRAISVHSVVPNDFGIGLIVPLVKDTRRPASTDRTARAANFRRDL